MHYIVVQICTTLQYNSIVRILDPPDAGEIHPPPVLDAVGTYLEQRSYQSPFSFAADRLLDLAELNVCC